jgi:hypothetical protein
MKGKLTNQKQLRGILSKLQIELITLSSIKDKEAPDEGEERKDYPEVPPSAMSNFVCDKCGKPFQNQNDLYQHKRFEGS